MLQETFLLVKICWNIIRIIQSSNDITFIAYWQKKVLHKLDMSYSLCQLWLPRPYLPGTSNGGAAGERDHRRLMQGEHCILGTFVCTSSDVAMTPLRTPFSFPAARPLDWWVSWMDRWIWWTPKSRSVALEPLDVPLFELFKSSARCGRRMHTSSVHSNPQQLTDVGNITVVMTVTKMHSFQFHSCVVGL